MFVWSYMVAAYWMAYCIRTGDQKHILLMLAAVYTIQHFIFDLIWYSPGYIYYASCAAADLFAYLVIKNFSYKYRFISLLLLLSATLNGFGYYLYIVETSNFMYDLTIVIVHAFILFALCKDHDNGRRSG